MSDDQRLPDPIDAVGRLLPGEGLVLRHRSGPERRRLALALRPICRRLKVFLIVAADPRLAMEVSAEGIHLSETDMRRPAKSLYWARQYGMFVTAAAHNEAAVRRAKAAQVHGILISPIYATRSHPKQPGLGILRFTTMTRSAALPAYGLGGIDQTNLMRLRQTGVAGIAGIGAIVNMD